MRIKRNKRQKVVRRGRRFGVRMSKKLVGLFFMVILALVLLTCRITYINITKGEGYSRTVLSQAQQRLQSRTIPYRRGDILDRNGTILATSEKVYKLVLDCAAINYEAEDSDGNLTKQYFEPTVNALHELFGIDSDEIRDVLTADYTKDKRYYVWTEEDEDGKSQALEISITEKKAFDEYTDIEIPDDGSLSKAEKEAMEALQKERNNIRGVTFEETYNRVYPLGSLACDTIGFTYTANEADWGIEGYYQDELNGTDGRQYGYYDSANSEDSYVEQEIVEPEDGKNVVSTIDVNIQQIIRQAIIDENAAIAEENGTQVKDGEEAPDGADNIAVIVMDPNNGEILGMDSTDWYDLNDPRDLTSSYTEETIAGMSDEDKLTAWNERWKNYCLSDVFEPGSTVKPVTIAGALETGSVTMTEKFKCDGSEEVSGSTIHCMAEHGDLTIDEAIKYSCNDVLMQVAADEGGTEFLRYQDIFNFGKKTGIDLPGESTGVTFDESTLGPVELATSSFGQGFTCTMIQEAAALSAIINGGDYYTPHVVSEIQDQDGTVEERLASTVEKRVISSEISDFLREAMGSVVEDNDGTGHSAKINGYSMGGKTGTAQKLPREDENYLVSFAGFAPLENPQVLVYVIVDHPYVEKQDTSSYAISIAKNIMTELLPYMNIFTDEELVEEDTEEETSDSEDATASEEDSDDAAYASDSYGSYDSDTDTEQ